MNEDNEYNFSAIEYIGCSAFVVLGILLALALALRGIG